MNLDREIQPEITNDSLSQQITSIIADNPNVKTILEIGASSGMGSTQAIIRGVEKRKDDVRVFCLEASTERCARFINNQINIAKRYEPINNVHLFNLEKDNTIHLYNYSSIGLDDYLSDDSIYQFYHNVLTNLNKYPFPLVLRWKEEEIEYIKGNRIPLYGISTIKQHHDIKTFDLVILDGSAFTGEADLCHIGNALGEWIVLDDINGIKNHHNHLHLKTSVYGLYDCDLNLRNGYSIFRRKK